MWDCIVVESTCSGIEQDARTIEMFHITTQLHLTPYIFLYSSHSSDQVIFGQNVINFDKIFPHSLGETLTGNTGLTIS